MVDAFTFGVALAPLPAVDSLAAGAPVTDIAGALDDLRKLHRRTPFNAVLLLSDGAYNRGERPAHAAERLGIPIVAVAVGDTTDGRDVLVARTAANSIVYEGVASPVDVTVRSSGADGERVEVRLLTEGRTVASSQLTLARGTREYTTRLAYVPEGTGMRRYTVSVSGLPGELVTENNRRTFFARVLKSRMKILILAGSPSPDFTALRISFEGSDRFDVAAHVQRPAGGWLGAPPPAAAVDSADCVVLVGFPTPATQEALLQSLTRTLLSRGTPVLFIGGRDIDHARTRTLGDLVPFTSAISSQTEHLIAVEPAAAHRNNQLLTLSRPEGVDAWRRLPPAYGTLTVFTAKPGAVILAEAQTQGGLAGSPLIVTRTVGGLKSMAVLAHGIWRWRLMAQGRPETATLLSDFLTASIEWLTTREDTRPFRVAPERAAFAQGEPAGFTAELYDANNRPVQDAAVSLSVQAGDTKVGVAMQSIGNGRYEGRIEGLPEGDYAYEARAVLAGAQLGTDTGRFAVGGVNVEYQETRTNPAVLREMAAVTGGAFRTSAEFDSAVAAVRALPSFAPSTVRHDRSVELWMLPALLGAIIALLAAEWFLRKRSGML
jgi:hypothetical protein